MALVNPNIAMGYRAPELPQQNALADYAAVQQIQSNRRQGEVADMQLEQMRRDQAALSRMQAAITAKGGPSDLNVAAEEMINSGIPEYFKQGLIIKQTLDKQSRFAKLFSPTGGAAPANAMYSPSEPYEGYNKDIGMTPSVNAMAAPTAAPVNAMADLRRKIDAAYQIGTPEALAFAKAGEDRLKSVTLSASSSVFDPQTQSFIQAPAAPPAPERKDTDLIRNFNAAKAQGFVGSIFDYEKKIKEAGRVPAQPRAEPQPQPPVAVVDPATGKQVFVSREEALSNRMTPAAAMESLPPKEIQKRETALPQATSSVKGFESKSDKFIVDLVALRDDPGLDNITGPIFGRTGSVSQAGSRAQALYDKVVAKGGFQSLQDLRDASKTGGALGNVSNQEGKQLIASFAAIDRRQNAEDVRAAINQTIADIQGTKTRMREAYDSTYSYKSGGTTSAASPAPAANVITNPKFPGFSIGK